MDLTLLSDNELRQLRYEKSKTVSTLNNTQMASKILN